MYRFYSKIKVGKVNGCWVWIAFREKDGYGRFKFNGKNIPAHRFSWINTYGEIPKGFLVLHKCDNPPCVNPEHLFLGTQKDNIRDMLIKNRDNYSFGEKHGLSKLKDKYIPEIRNLYKDGNTIKYIAGVYEVSLMAIHRIIKGRAWKHV